VGGLAKPSVSSLTSERDERAVLKYLWPTIESAGEVGRIYYRAVCQSNDNLPVQFPRVDVQPPSRGKTGLDAVREIFRNDKSVTVMEDKGGIIRIRIGEFPTAILQTKISNLTLGPLGQYNYWLAIGAIESTPEVRSAMNTLKLSVPLKFYDMLVQQPAEGLPHVTSSMTNVTMDQALDSVTVAFRGIVLYGACVPPGLYKIDFTGGTHFDDAKLNDGTTDKVR
jgi:hypothetical protein